MLLIILINYINIITIFLYNYFYEKENKKYFILSEINHTFLPI